MKFLFKKKSINRLRIYVCIGLLLLLIPELGKAEVYEKSCVCFYGLVPEDTISAWKRSCRRWIEKNQCSESQILPGVDNMGFMANSNAIRELNIKSKKIYVGYFNHWSPWNTIRFLENDVIPFVQETSYSIDIDHHGCSVMANQSYFEQNGEKMFRQLPEGASVFITGSQVTAVGENTLYYLGWLYGNTNNVPAMWSSISGYTLPKCTDFVHEKCRGYQDPYTDGPSQAHCKKEDGTTAVLTCNSKRWQLN